MLRVPDFFEASLATVWAPPGPAKRILRVFPGAAPDCYLPAGWLGGGPGSKLGLLAERLSCRADRTRGRTCGVVAAVGARSSGRSGARRQVLLHELHCSVDDVPLFFIGVRRFFKCFGFHRNAKHAADVQLHPQLFVHQSIPRSSVRALPVGSKVPFLNHWCQVAPFEVRNIGENKPVFVLLPLQCIVSNLDHFAKQGVFLVVDCRLCFLALDLLLVLLPDPIAFFFPLRQ
mmetsp:Transcript_25521/g.54449  ORF Transcript_25521/g.54449 Transcript_25521/m.54449 type:complete len:231 (+) Transcript_25521:840-1532(+)